MLFGLALMLSFCGTKEAALRTTPDLPESKKRLYGYVVERNLPFQRLLVRNIRVKYNSPGGHTRLYASMKMVRDSALLLSLRSPLGIELTRVLYRKDSVMMLDRRNKKAYFTDYSRLSEILPFDFNFLVLQSVFSGNVPVNFRRTSYPEPRSARDTLRNEVYLGTFEAAASGNQFNFYGWIYTDTARPSYIVFYDDSVNNQYHIRYREYQALGSRRLPESVEVEFDQANQTHTLVLKLGGISVDEDFGVEMAVPSSYETIIR
jgi:hypothetical protein